MRPLGPFGAAPRIAVGVSGGADSTCLALLAHDWAAARGGSALAIVIDHGLRPESGKEAELTTGRLLERGIKVSFSVLRDLQPGPGLAERARDARFGVFAEVCGEEGIAHLLLGHHAGDQAETVIIRQSAGSGEAGMAGMAAVTHARWGRVTRPLLAIAPSRIRATLRTARMRWIEDPSNHDLRATRPRVRAIRDDPGGDGLATRTLVGIAIERGRQRALAEARDARILAASVSIRPEGFAVLDLAAMSASALAALIRTIAGSRYAPSVDRCASLLAHPRGATLGGARLLPGGRIFPGRWLLAREARAVAEPITVEGRFVWDNRWRLGQKSSIKGVTVEALGPADSARLRRELGRILPVAVMATLPAIRRGGMLLAAPLLQWPDESAACDWPISFEPSRPAACAPFLAAGAALLTCPPNDRVD